MQIEGEIQVGEATAYASKAIGRLTGAPWPFLLTLVSGLAAGLGAVLIPEVAEELGLIPSFLMGPITIIGLVLGIWLVTRSCRQLSVRNFRRSLAARGISGPLQTTYVLDADMFVCLSEGIEYRARWSQVSELVRAGPYWVALVQSLPFYIPRRFFADPQAEKQFLNAMLEHMEPGARDRSGEAAKFLRS